MSRTLIRYSTFEEDSLCSHCSLTFSKETQEQDQGWAVQNAVERWLSHAWPLPTLVGIYLSMVEHQTQVPTASPPPGIRSYHPTTFLECGVMMPFTTPLLTGTRIRPSDRSGFEFVVPNPSGATGVYIMAWKGITSLCNPTLHDSALTSRMAALTNITPSTIRRVAREIAAGGLAGEDAMDAARDSMESQDSNKLLTTYRLLALLMRQVDIASATTFANLNQIPQDMEKHAKLTIARAAPLVNRSTSWVVASLEALASVMGDVGVGTADDAHRSPYLVSKLRKTAAEIAEWNKNQDADDQAADADLICLSADLTLALAMKLLSDAHALTADMIGLLRKWATDPSAVSRVAGRPEWVLDGWEQIGLLWDDAVGNAAKRAALLEIIGCVPILPREAGEWGGTAVDASGAHNFRRRVRAYDDWRAGGAQFDLIARNERLVAASYGNPSGMPSRQASDAAGQDFTIGGHR